MSCLRQPWHVYGFGVLFGLGFDTASSVAVLVLATSLPAGTTPLILLSLPLLFAAAMTLGDDKTSYGQESPCRTFPGRCSSPC